MKVLIVGLGQMSHHENSLMLAFQELGINCKLFKYVDHLQGKIGYFSHRFLIGPRVEKINELLRSYVDEIEPDIIFLYRALTIKPSLVNYFSKKGVVVVSFNPDTISGKNGYKAYWRFYKKYISYCDINYIYRDSDFEALADYKVKNVRILESFFIRSLTSVEAPINFTSKLYDVGFYGHCEPDSRLNIVRKLSKQNYNLAVSGVYWDKFYKHPVDAFALFGGSLSIRDYVEKINQTRICLSFLSTWNQDLYTRRVFEIPACGSVLAVPRNDKTLQIYNESEAIFFSSYDELNKRIQFFLSHPDAWEEVHQAGRERVFSSGYEIKDRVKTILGDIDQLC